MLGVISLAIFTYGMYRFFFPTVCVEDHSHTDSDTDTDTDSDTDSDMDTDTDTNSDTDTNTNTDTESEEHAETVSIEESEVEIQDEEPPKLVQTHKPEPIMIFEPYSVILEEDVNLLDRMWESFDLETKYLQIMNKIPHLGEKIWRDRIRKQMIILIYNPLYQADYKKYIANQRSTRELNCYKVVEDTVLNLLEYYEDKKRNFLNNTGEYLPENLTASKIKID